jgi:hypothetical protein
MRLDYLLSVMVVISDTKATASLQAIPDLL